MIFITVLLLNEPCYYSLTLLICFHWTAQDRDETPAWLHMLCLVCHLCFGTTVWQTHTEDRESLSALQSTSDWWLNCRLKGFQFRAGCLKFIVSHGIWYLCIHWSLMMNNSSCLGCWSDWQQEEFHRFQHWLLMSLHLHVTQKRIAVFTLWSGLSSVIIVMLGVFTWTLNWTEIVHMSRMIHSLARAHNPLHLWWIIYVAVHSTELT